MEKFRKLLHPLYRSIQPALVILAMVTVLQIALVAYDRVETKKQKNLSNQLSKKFGVTTDCSRLINPGESTDLKFEFENKNDQAIDLNTINVDINLTGTNGKVYSKIIKTNPQFKKKESIEPQFTSLVFEKVSVEANSKKEIVLTLEGASRIEAGGSPNTIVGYTGTVVFDFTHEITTKPSCTVQVRYSP